MTHHILKHALFEHELRTTTAHFGRDNNIQVVFSGGDVRTDGKTVHLPALDPTKPIDDQTMKAIRGFVDHEAGGHCRYTTPAVTGRAHQRGELFKTIYMGLEDIRIDKAHTDQFPGAKTNIRATQEMVAKMDLDGLADTPEVYEDAPAIAGVTATWLGRKKLGLAGTAVDDNLAKVPDHIKQVVQRYVDEALKAGSSDDVFKLADRLATEIKLVEPPRPPQGDGDGQGGQGQQGQGQQGQGDQQDGGGQGGQGQQGQPGDGQDQGQGAPAGQGGGEQGGQGGGGAPPVTGGRKGNGAGGLAPINPELDRIFDKVPKAVNNPRAGAIADVIGANQWARRAYETKMTGPSGTDARVDRWRSNLSTGLRKYTETKTSISSAIGVMQKTFERLLAAHNMRDREHGLEDGRLDARRLTQASLGNRRVFWMPGQRKEVNTYVEILIDISGSMSGTELHNARLALVAIGEALERCGIKWAATCYSTPYNTGEMAEKMRGLIASAERLARASRTQTHEVTATVYPPLLVELKAAEEPLSKARKRIGAMTSLADGGTPTGSAIATSWPRMMKRDEPRKVMIVITDGQPDNVTYAKAMVDEAEASKVEMIGIGIGCNSVKNMFKHYAVVNGANDLIGATLAQLKRAIVGEEEHVRKSRVRRVA